MYKLPLFVTKSEDIADAHILLGLITKKGVRETLALLQSKEAPKKRPVASQDLSNFIGMNCACGDCSRLLESELSDPWFFLPGRHVLTSVRRPAVPIHLFCESLAMAFKTEEGKVRGHIFPKMVHKAIAKAAVTDLATLKAKANTDLVEIETASRAAQEMLKATAARQIVNSGQAADTIVAPLQSTSSSTTRSKQGSTTETRTRVVRASDRNSETVFVAPTLGHRTNNQQSITDHDTPAQAQIAIEYNQQLTSEQVADQRDQRKQLEMNNLRAAYQKEGSNGTLRAVVDSLAHNGIYNPMCLIASADEHKRVNGSNGRQLMSLAQLQKTGDANGYCKNMFKWLKLEFKGNNAERLVEVNRAFQ